MAKRIFIGALCLALLLGGCRPAPQLPTEPTELPVNTTVPLETTLPPETTVPVETTMPAETTLPPETTVPVETTMPTETTVPTDPPITGYSIPGVSVDSVITYFNEVVLDAEFVHSGDPSRVQKWMEPILYQINGTPTETDLVVLREFCDWLNTVEGFPGIRETQDALEANLQIHFCSVTELINIMGDQFYGTDGGVTFWYMNNEIYDATICYRNDIDQYIRNSVILEEIYNGLGPLQDTSLRTDSICFSGYSTPQSLTEVDELILKLLYHPEIRCGMNKEQCAQVIRSLYHEQ